ncbi:hypothetical protein Q3G72_011521 [Acer saccharum]|nr:hypothetical protein Q3G72_011521 [Acer saccharum]
MGSITTHATRETTICSTVTQSGSARATGLTRPMNQPHQLKAEVSYSTHLFLIKKWRRAWRSHPIPAKGKGQVSRSINRNSQPCPSISTEIVKASRELNAWFISSNQSTLKGGKSSKGKAGTTRSSPRSELGFVASSQPSSDF